MSDKRVTKGDVPNLSHSLCNNFKKHPLQILVGCFCVIILIGKILPDLNILGEQALPMERKNKGTKLIILVVIILVLCKTFISMQDEINFMLNSEKTNPWNIGSYINTRQNEKPYIVPPEGKSNKEFTIQGVYLTQSEEELISNLGEPDRKALSEYGFYWYIYNKDYSKYIQVGVKDGTVVGIYTNADNWKTAKGINIGMTRSDVERLLGRPLQGITKNRSVYLISEQDEKGIYLVDGSYVSVFYDIHNKNTVTSLQLIDENVELGLDGHYGDYSEELRDSFERQIFDLANSIRARNNLKPFIWSNKGRASSRKHSQDMADNNFFAHVNLKRESPFDRMKKEKIVCVSAAENIAAGSANAIQAHEGWMNSAGHRVNILGNYETLGVGVGYNSDSEYKYYYTQNFFAGR